MAMVLRGVPGTVTCVSEVWEDGGSKPYPVSLGYDPGLF
jgi:hypothetical protein